MMLPREEKTISFTFSCIDCYARIIDKQWPDWNVCQEIVSNECFGVQPSSGNAKVYADLKTVWSFTWNPKSKRIFPGFRSKSVFLLLFLLFVHLNLFMHASLSFHAVHFPIDPSFFFMKRSSLTKLRIKILVEQGWKRRFINPAPRGYDPFDLFASLRYERIWHKHFLLLSSGKGILCGTFRRRWTLCK